LFACKVPSNYLVKRTAFRRRLLQALGSIMTPADSYHEALNSHRHYDTMANAALSLIGAALAGGPALYAATSRHPGAELVLVLPAVVIYFAVQTYKRFDAYAATALNVAAAIEQGDVRFSASTLGFAAVFKNINNFPDLVANGLSRTYRRIRVVGYTACALFILAACAIAATRFVGSA
jgi:hypothetical protein